MKKNLTRIVGGIIVLATMFTSCKKETEMQPLEKNVANEQMYAGQNGQYGPWLKFANRTAYETYINKVKEILESSANSDSVLDLLDQQHQFISLRQYYNNSAAEDAVINTADQIAHGSLAAVLNSNGVVQIEDTIIRLAKHYAFTISNADESTLQSLDAYMLEENIDDVVLPENVKAYKVYRSISENTKNMGAGYDISYTEARDYYVGSKNRYKLVAGYICYSYIYPFRITEYYSSTKFEYGIKNIRGVWNWKSDWALPLSLNCGNNFKVYFGKVNATITRSNLTEVYGERKELRFYYFYESRPRFIYYYEPLTMYSIHKSVRAEKTLEITITKP